MTVERVAIEFARQHFGPGVNVSVVPLSGGLEARGIGRVVVHRGKKPVGSFVAKPFTGAASRELEVYCLLKAAPHHHQIAPALLGWRHTGRNHGYAFLEWVRAEGRWPWQNVDCSLLVVEQLATLHGHDMPLPFRAALARWDYERELSESAHSTLNAYRSTFRTGLRPGKRPMVRAIERLVAALPRLRHELLGFAGTALLHGDAHPGNVVLTRKAAKKRPVFIDWARARIGSPLEDVSSWVHSLSLWEPEAKRRHDTMLYRYLVARGSAATVSRTFRDACILAGACNALAGALRYHLSVLTNPESSPRAQFDSYRAAADWLRIIRRADVCFGV
jgi:Ser/Thr protein kinase RdoA (MazF antagonist)